MPFSAQSRVQGGLLIQDKRESDLLTLDRSTLQRRPLAKLEARMWLLHSMMGEREALGKCRGGLSLLVLPRSGW